jgi:hypothetical protein
MPLVEDLDLLNDDDIIPQSLMQTNLQKKFL